MTNGWVAHQGGWDEFLIFISPIPVLVVLRLLERRRAKRREADRSPSPSPPAST